MVEPAEGRWMCEYLWLILDQGRAPPKPHLHVSFYQSQNWTRKHGGSSSHICSSPNHWGNYIGAQHWFVWNMVNVTFKVFMHAGTMVAIFFCCCQWDWPCLKINTKTPRFILLRGCCHIALTNLPCYHQCVCHFTDSACSRMKWTRSRSTLKRTARRSPFNPWFFIHASMWLNQISFFSMLLGYHLQASMFFLYTGLGFFSFQMKIDQSMTMFSMYFLTSGSLTSWILRWNVYANYTLVSQTDGQSCMFEWYSVYICYGKNTSSYAHSYVRFQKKWALKPNHRLLYPTSTLQAIQASTLWAMTLPGRDRGGEVASIVNDFWNSLEL